MSMKSGCSVNEKLSQIQTCHFQFDPLQVLTLRSVSRSRQMQRKATKTKQGLRFKAGFKAEGMKSLGSDVQKLNVSLTINIINEAKMQKKYSYTPNFPIETFSNKEAWI